MYRIFSDLLDPFLVLFLSTGLALAWIWFRQPESRPALRPVVLLFLGLWATCTPAVAFLAVGSLEWHYPPPQSRPEQSVDAIVVLGGAIRPPNEFQADAELGEDTLYRCLRAAKLYQAGDPLPVIVSGGKVDPNREGPSLAAAMSDFLAANGVPLHDIVLEEASRTTHENAVESATILRKLPAQRIILVTDATHLLRSDFCFRAQGLDVLPRGSRYRATQFRWQVQAFLPTGSAATTVKSVVHEWAGLGWYWWNGRFEVGPADE